MNKVKWKSARTWHLLLIISLLVWALLCPTRQGAGYGTMLLPEAGAAPQWLTHGRETAPRNETWTRLSHSVEPVRYELLFEPDLKESTFAGRETIHIKVAVETAQIVLNADDLTVGSASLKSENGGDSPADMPCTVAFSKETETVKIIAPQALKPGDYALSLEFKGILNDKLRGFYRSTYTDAGVKKSIATTQLEATDARRMFPCFDEPDFKATFQITAVIDKDLVAISNAPVESETASGAKKAVHFEETPKMSTYLVALVVGDFRYLEGKADGIPIRVYAVAGKEKLAAYALGVAERVLPFLNRYFAIPFPNKKLDLIAIPDFAPGAMENLGAITFREESMLIDEKTGSVNSRQSLAEFLAHEMAHQWFGDLVTMSWWDDVWLNEAFATWMATKTVDNLFPEWHVRVSALYSKFGAMGSDDIRSTRAIHAVVRNPSQALEMFDNITYEKGSAILTMLESFVCDETFRKGVQLYLRSHAYANATTDDLWHAIEQAGAKVPVDKVMHSWIYQAGLPLVDARVAQSRDSVSLKQSRYFVDKSSVADKTIWQVPIVYRLPGAIGGQSEGGGTSALLGFGQARWTIDCRKQAVLLNAGANGFYRVHYDAENFNHLLDHFQDLTTEEKLTLIDDIQSFVFSDRAPVEEELNLISKLKDEKNDFVRMALTGILSGLHDYLQESEMAPYRKLAKSLVKPILTEIGWAPAAGELQSRKDLRNQLISILGNYGQDKETIDQALAAYKKYMVRVDAIDPDLVETILHVVAFNGGLPQYEQMRSGWMRARNPNEQHQFMFALTAFRQPDLIKHTLAWSLSKQLRSQDAPHVLGSLIRRRSSRDIAWPFFTSNWPTITARFSHWSLRGLVFATSSFDTPQMEAQVRRFYSTHHIKTAIKAEQRMLEDLHNNVIYRERNEARIKAWLKKTAARYP